MSAAVLPFVRPARKPAPREFPAKPLYGCLACDSIEFRIYETGGVYCAKCTAPISNLFAKTI